MLIDCGGFLLDDLPRLRVRFICPILWSALRLLRQMLFVNKFVQVLDVLFFRIAGMFKQKRVPGPVKVAIIVAAFGRAKDRQLNVIPAACYINGMERLVQIADKMNDPLQGFQSVGAGGFFIGKNLAENFNAIDGAVVVVSLRVFVIILRTKAVTLI